MAELENEKNLATVQTPKSSHSNTTEEAPHGVIDTEKNASAGGTYFVRERDGDNHLKTAKDGITFLIPQPSDDPLDPLNWSWGCKHKVLLSLLLPSLLTDWGMTWVLFWVPSSGHDNGPDCDIHTNIRMIYDFPYSSRFFAAAPQVIGISVVHDLFFFHERARKVNIWAFPFLVGPYAGPLVSSFLLAKISWRFDMGVLAIFYAVSLGLVILLVEETLYDKEKTMKATDGASKFSIMIGIAGARAKGQSSMASVTKHLLELLIRPQLLLPTLFILLLFTWAIGIVTTVIQFIRPPPYLLDDTAASLFYFAPIVGAVVGELWGHWFNDFLCNRYIRTHNGEYQPENRLWGVWLGVAFGVASLVLYGQNLEKQLTVIGLAAAWAIMSFAQVCSTTAISAYALDWFPHHAALSNSWINFWRTTGGFCVTYFQTQV